MGTTPNIIIAGPTGTLVITPSSGASPAMQRFQVFTPHGAGPAAQMQADTLLRTLPQNAAAEQDARHLYEQRGFFMPSAHDLEHLLRRDLTDGIFITAYYVPNPSLVPQRPAETTKTDDLLTDPPGAPAQWTATQRVSAMLRRIPKHVPLAMRDQVAALFTPEAIAVLAIFLAALAIAQFYGVGEIVDAFLVGLAWGLAGLSGIAALGHFVSAIIAAARAKTLPELDQEAATAAAAIVTLGLAFLTAVLLRARAEQKMSSAKPPEPEPEPEPRTKQILMRQNAAQGKAFEQKGLAYLKTQQNDVEDQVSIRPYNDDGTLANYRVRVDAVGTDDDGTYQLTDFKSSDTAGFTPNQTTGYPLLEKNGGVVVGDNGGDAYPAGTQIPPTAVNILTPNDIP